MKTVLAHGYLATAEDAIFVATKDTVVKKFWLINNSLETRTININRIVDNEASNVVKVNFTLASGWSIDILDPGDEWNFKKGDFIRAKCSSQNSIHYTIDGE